MLRKALLGLVATATLAGPASPQTVDELVAQLAAARGGLDKLHAVRSLRMLGHMTLGRGLEAPVTVERKRPQPRTRSDGRREPRATLLNQCRALEGAGRVCVAVGAPTRSAAWID